MVPLKTATVSLAGSEHTTMSFLNDVIAAALRDQNVPQLGSTGTTPLADALRSLLAPRSTEAGLPADATHLEPDALQQLMGRFQQGGFADILQSWIGTGANQPISPQQVGQALGPGKVTELSNQTGLPHETLLSELARLLPTIVDCMTPQGRLPHSNIPPAAA
jgi:uncharacterized protein YidB (DUF937 family)